MNAYIAIGANIGDRKYYINKALEMIEENVGKIEKKSKIIETKPYGFVSQDDFLNCVIKVSTDIEPRKLLKKLNIIEECLGRERIIRWGPRTIDLDIILYDDVIIDEDDLHIPHIDFLNRDFVIDPLIEICPDIVNPRTNKKIKEYKKNSDV